MNKVASITYRRIPVMLKFGVITVLMSILVACNDDDIQPSPQSAGNSNSNVSMLGTADTRSYGEVVQLGYVKAVTEGSESLRDAACRLEIPRLNGGADNLFVVHTTNDYGINYCIEWNCSLRAQYWSAFRWDKSNSVTHTSRTNQWAEDPLIPISYRSTLADHSNNGYDRGHILGSQDRVNSYEANAQTFYMSNMHPQLNGFNSGDGRSNWYTLELRLRDRYNRDSFRDTLYVVKGGTISQGMYKKAKNNLPVPNYFFMAVLRKKNSDPTQGGYAAVGFWMEHKSNTDSNVKNYAVSIDELEELTGIDFFCNLPDNVEALVEKNFSSALWGLN